MSSRADRSLVKTRCGLDYVAGGEACDLYDLAPFYLGRICTLHTRYTDPAQDIITADTGSTAHDPDDLDDLDRDLSDV